MLPRVPHHDAEFLRQNSWRGNRSRTELWSRQYTWRIIEPLPNGHSWLINGGYWAVTSPGMILHVTLKSREGLKDAGTSENVWPFFGVVSFHVTWIQTSCKGDSEKSWGSSLVTGWITRLVFRFGISCFFCQGDPGWWYNSHTELDDSSRCSSKNTEIFRI